jgi:hypothetical protein
VTTPIGLLWAADLTAGSRTDLCGYGNTQRQNAGGSIQNSSTGAPVVDHPALGRAVKLQLTSGQVRLECAPGPAGSGLGEGTRRFFRTDFYVDAGYPALNNALAWGPAISQLHQASGSGSPPVEFDLRDGWLIGCGGDNSPSGKKWGDTQLAKVTPNTVHSLIFGVTVSADPAKSVLDVWFDGTKVLDSFLVPCSTMWGGASYWKGATIYMGSGNQPQTIYQAKHRVGTTLESVQDPAPVDPPPPPPPYTALPPVCPTCQVAGWDLLPGSSSGWVLQCHNLGHALAPVAGSDIPLQ